MKGKAPLLFLFGRKLSRSLASLSQFLLWVGGGLFGGLQNRGLARTRSSPKEGLRSRKRHLSKVQGVRKKDKVERGGEAPAKSERRKSKTRRKRKTDADQLEKKKQNSNVKGKRKTSTKGGQASPSLSARECSCKLATPQERKRETRCQWLECCSLSLPPPSPSFQNRSRPLRIPFRCLVSSLCSLTPAATTATRQPSLPLSTPPPSLNKAPSLLPFSPPLKRNSTQR